MNHKNGEAMIQANEVKFESFYTIENRAGLCLAFSIDGLIYERFSGYGNLLWWKDYNKEYLNKEDTEYLEKICTPVLMEEIKKNGDRFKDPLFLNEFKT